MPSGDKDQKNDVSLAAAPQCAHDAKTVHGEKAGDAALLGELCDLLFRKRWNAIEISNLAFILRHREHIDSVPEAGDALACVERYGRELVTAGAGAAVGDASREQAVQCLQRAAAALGLEHVLERHEQAT